ncbi:zinc-binding dehydrogenase [Rhodococcus sp. NPDC056743]|uniref:zinc-binding dehydrogenase n=1 Tax=Rhodococcus sp. NPDC056743 TaxID=3345934 RepID=UPI00366D99FA
MRALIGGLDDNWVMKKDSDTPEMKLGALRVRVMTAALNRADLYMLEGTYNPNMKQGDVYPAGMEYAGVVETSSPLAPHLPVGTRVMGVTMGAFADYALCDPRMVLPIPEHLSFEDAAALPVALATENDALTRAGFSAGKSVLVVGGTTAIGLSAIQLAKALGAATVIATTTRSDKKQLLLDLGSDVAIDTATEDLTQHVLDATEGAGVDIVLDHVGGELFARLPAATKVGGSIVNIGRLAGPATALDLDQVALRRINIIGTTFSVRTQDELAEVCSALNAEVMPAVAAGKITPHIDRVYAAEDAHDAAERLRANAALGKIVLSFAENGPNDESQRAPVANFFGSIAQLGYVVRDIDASLEGFVASGIGPWFLLRGVQPENFTYKGVSSAMAMDVAVANSGDIQIEVICPVNDEPSMYRDFLDAGNEGLQHFAYWTSDFQTLYDKAVAAGFTVGQEGQLGGPTGRFAYLNTEHHPGTCVEISDLGGAKAQLFDYVKLAAAHWDGSNPVQVIDPNMLAAH